MLFIATKALVYSLSPFAKSLHITTIAIHLAKPMMITPCIYKGSSFKKIKAKINISKGPMNQFKIIESKITFLESNTFKSFA